MIYHHNSNIRRLRWVAIAWGVALVMTGCGLELNFGQKKEEKPSGPPPKSEEELAAEAAAEAALEAERARIKALAKARLAEAMATVPKFDRDAAVARLMLEQFEIDIESLPDPLPTPKELRAMLFKEINKQVDQAFSEKRKDEVQAEAISKYPFYKIGDVVQVETRRGGAKDRLEGVSDDRIKVGPHIILFSDLVDPDESAFKEEVIAKRRAHFVNVQYNWPRGKLIARLETELRTPIYNRNGYAQVKGQNGKLSWKRASHIVETVIVPQVDALEAEYMAEHEAAMKKKVRDEMAAEGILWK